MRVFTIDVAKGCVSFELWLPEQMGRFDKWSIAVLSRHGAALPTLSARRRIPLCSPLLHRYLLYPQPNVIGLRSILRNCFPPPQPPVNPSPSVTFTYLLCFPRIVILAHVSVSPVQRSKPEVQWQLKKNSEPLRSDGIRYISKIWGFFSI